MINGNIITENNTINKDDIIINPSTGNYNNSNKNIFKEFEFEEVNKNYFLTESENLKNSRKIVDRYKNNSNKFGNVISFDFRVDLNKICDKYNKSKFEFLFTEEFDQINSNLNSRRKENKNNKSELNNIDSYSDQNLNNSTNHQNSNSNLNTNTDKSGNIDSPISSNSTSPHVKNELLIYKQFLQKEENSKILKQFNYSDNKYNNEANYFLQYEYYKQLYLDKCNELEEMQKKFEEISNNFNLVFDNMNKYQNCLLEDNKSLKDILNFTLESYSQRQFECLNYIIEYVNKNETFFISIEFSQQQSNININLCKDFENNYSIEKENKKVFNSVSDNSLISGMNGENKPVKLRRHSRSFSNITPTIVDFNQLKILKKKIEKEVAVVNTTNSYNNFDNSKSISNSVSKSVNKTLQKSLSLKDFGIKRNLSYKEIVIIIIKN